MTWQILKVATGERADEDNMLPVQLRLARYEVESRVPLVTIERRRGFTRERYSVRVPLMPGYIFAKASTFNRARMDAQALKGVYGWLIHNGRLVSVSDAEVRRMMAMDDGKQKTVQELFTVGSTVNVTQDAWQGVDMLVLEDRGPEHDTIRVGVDMFGLPRAIEVRKFNAEKVA